MATQESDPNRSDIVPGSNRDDDDDDWLRDALVTAKTSGSKKGGSKKKGKKPKKEEDWTTKRDRDLKHCQSVAGTWLSFTLGQARLINLNSNSQLRDAFTRPCNMKSLEAIDEWTTAVQQAICYYVLLEMIMKEDDRGESRVQQFQALGRGWIFILLKSTALTKCTHMKVWFESSDRVLHDHEMDMRSAELTGSTREKYLWGYNPEAEIVFFIKGLAPARPLVCIQRLRPDYRDLDKWAIKPEAKMKCLEKNLPSDAEREKVVQQHKRRKNQRKKKKKEKEAEREIAERITREILQMLRSDSASVDDSDLKLITKPEEVRVPASTGDSEDIVGAVSQHKQPLHGGITVTGANGGESKKEDEDEGDLTLLDAPSTSGNEGQMTPRLGASNAPVLRSARTLYGTGLVKKIHPDGKLELEMLWDHNEKSGGNSPTRIAASHGMVSIASSAMAVANKNFGDSVSLPVDATQSKHVLGSGSSKLKGSVMYVPRPWSVLQSVETTHEFEEAKRLEREKEVQQFEAEDSQKTFDEMLAEMKAEEARAAVGGGYGGSALGFL